MIMKRLLISLILVFAIFCLAFARLRTKCKCNFKVDDMPENSNHTLDNIFPNKYRKSRSCDEGELEKCKRRCIRKESKAINGNLDALYPNVNVPHGEIICYWLANDVDSKALRIEAVLECGNKFKVVDTGIVYNQPLTCKTGHYISTDSKSYNLSI